MDIINCIDIIEKEKYIQRVLKWYDKNKRTFPWRKVTDPYKIMVAEILLQKTNANKVILVYDVLISKFPNITQLLNANVEDIKEIIRPLGLIKKANFLKKCSLMITTEYGGIIPDNKEKLLNLPGIGNYTSNAILCFSYNKYVPLMDVNIARILRRLFNLPSKKRVESDTNITKLAEKIIQKNQPFNIKNYHYGLIDLSASICKHKNPICPECPFNNFCIFCAQGRTYF